MTIVIAYKNLGITRDIAILDADGNAITPGVNDKVRARIGYEGQTSLFEVTSGINTAAGSSITTGAANRLRIDSSDLSFSPGVYTLSIDYFDNADAQEWKCVDRQVFSLQGGGGNAVDVSAVLLELGLSGSVTEEERALSSYALQRATAAVRQHLRYDPVQATRVEYYPQSSPRTGGGGVVEMLDADDTQAFVRRLTGANSTELQLANIPVRSIMSLYVDYDGRAGTRVGAFAAATLKVEGTDYWLNYDATDSVGLPICKDGIVWSGGLWPSAPGSVKITYVSGYTMAELAGQSPNVDAGLIGESVLEEAVTRVKRALVMKKRTIIGHIGGLVTSERLGDYSYSLDAGTAGRLFGNAAVSPATMDRLSGFVHYGFQL